MSSRESTLPCFVRLVLHVRHADRKLKIDWVAAYGEEVDHCFL